MTKSRRELLSDESLIELVNRKLGSGTDTGIWEQIIEFAGAYKEGKRTGVQADKIDAILIEARVAIMELRRKANKAEAPAGAAPLNEVRSTLIGQIDGRRKLQ